MAFLIRSIFSLFLSLLLTISFALSNETKIIKQVPQKNTDPISLKKASVDKPKYFKKLIGSIYLSEQFLNEQIAKHIFGSELMKSASLDMKTEGHTLLVNGLLQVPFDNYQGLGIDPSIAQFKFQMTILPYVNEEGYVVLEFPFEKSFLYQAKSNNPNRDKIVLPVQLISLGIASTRSYLSALSGDFTSFEIKNKKLKALLTGIQRNLKIETNKEAIEVLKDEKRSLELQIESNNLQRQQFERTSQSLANIMGLVGDKGFNLNEKVKAFDNKILLKLKLESFVPYLADIAIGGVRVKHKDKDGKGEDYFAIDLQTKTKKFKAKKSKEILTPKRSLDVPPSILVRLNQELFLSESIAAAKKEKMGDSIKNFKMVFEDDGLHIKGSYWKWFFYIPFDVLVNFESTKPDEFEVRVGKLNAFGLNLKLLTRMALQSVKSTFETMFDGVFKFTIDEESKGRVLKVNVDSAKLIPAFPNLHLMDITVLEGSFLLRLGRTKEENL